MFSGAPHAVGGVEPPRRLSTISIESRLGILRIISGDSTFSRMAWFAWIKGSEAIEVVFRSTDGTIAEANRILQESSLQTGLAVEMRFSFLQGRVFSPVRTLVLHGCEAVELGGTMVKGKPATRWLLKATRMVEERDQ